VECQSVPCSDFGLNSGEFEGKRVLGKEGVAILEQIKKDGSISRAAEKLRMAYRYA
jgi:molybdenum-dependent DNA-binding transcriptional regulator ModE